MYTIELHMYRVSAYLTVHVFCEKTISSYCLHLELVCQGACIYNKIIDPDLDSEKSLGPACYAQILPVMHLSSAHKVMLNSQYYAHNYCNYATVHVAILQVFILITSYISTSYAFNFTYYVIL